MTPQKPSRTDLAAKIDHAVLRPETTLAELHAACEIAARNRVACLCVRPCDVSEARRILAEVPVAVGTVVSFPHGSSAPSVKVAEARRAIDDGATELDMVLNVSRLIDGPSAPRPGHRGWGLPDDRRAGGHSVSYREAPWHWKLSYRRYLEYSPL